MWDRLEALARKGCALQASRPSSRPFCLALSAGLWLAACVALAACAGNGPPPQGGPRAIVGLNPDGAALEVLVEALPPGALLREVWLAGPAGQRLSGVPLEQSRRDAAPSPARNPALPDVGVAASGGSASGVRPSVSLHWGPEESGPLGGWRDSRWLIPLPAAVRPSLAQGDWWVELHYLDNDGIARVLRRRVRV